MTVVVQRPLSPATIEAKLKAIVCECNRQVKQAPKGKKQKTCAQIGEEKHECCDKAIKKEKHPQMEGEKGYWPNGTQMKKHASRTACVKAGQAKGTCWPDAMSRDANGNPDRLYDFKFKCPKGTPVRKKKKGGNLWIKATGKAKWPGWTKYKGGGNQAFKYIKLGKKMKPPIVKKPKVINNKGCRK